MLCFTSDVVSEYAFGPQHSYNLLGLEDFAPSLLAANKKAGECSHTMKQFPFLGTVFNRLSLAWVKKLSPDFGLILEFQEVI
jgi:hypothetical protein